MKSIDDTLSGTNKMIPPTSGGFLGYSPNKRTIKSNTKMRSSGGGNTPLMLFEPAKKPLSNEEILRKQLHDAYTAGHVSFNPVPQANRKVQDAQMHFTSAPDATAPILLNSFPTTTEGPLGITKKPVSDVETQVDMSVYKKHFHGLSEYTNWMMRDVDPFLNVSTSLFSISCCVQMIDWPVVSLCII